MPVAAIHSLPAVLGAARRRVGDTRHAARFGLRASSLETATVAVNGEVRAAERKKTTEEARPAGLETLYDDGFGSVTVKDYFEAARAVSRDDGGPPRWFCPVEGGGPAVEDAPLLLFLPGALTAQLSAGRIAYCLHFTVYSLHFFTIIFYFFKLDRLPYLKYLFRYVIM
jgi:hypothetical protein